MFPCDFYVLDKYKVGNIKEQSFQQLYEKLEENSFFQDADKRDIRCPDCRWYPICRGGCRRDCSVEKQQQHNYYCEAYQEIFSYVIERLEYLARR